MNSLEAKSLDHFPEEILAHINSYLSFQDKVIMSLVSNTWNRIVGLPLYKNAKMSFNYQIFRDMTLLSQPSEENIALMNIVAEKIKSGEIFSEEFFWDDVFFQPKRLMVHSPSTATIVKKTLVSGVKKVESGVKSGVRSFGKFCKGVTTSNNSREIVEVKQEEIVEQDCYKKLMNAMEKITLTNNYNLLVLEYPLAKDEYTQFARNTNLPKSLFNVVYTANSNMPARIANSLTSQKLNTLILSRSISKNHEAMQGLSLHIGYSLIKTVKLSEVSVVEEDQPDYSAIGPISEVLTKIQNLETLLINEFQMTNNDALDLGKLITSVETLKNCEIVGEGSLTNDGLGCLFEALRDRPFETDFKFKCVYHSSDHLQEGLAALQSLNGAPNLFITLEKVTSETQIQ